jgi:hypothetical protein
MWITQEPKEVALRNKRHFKDKNGQCAASLKYSVFIFVEKKYIKCKTWRVAVRPSYIEDARFLKVKILNNVTLGLCILQYFNMEVTLTDGRMVLTNLSSLNLLCIFACQITSKILTDFRLSARFGYVIADVSSLEWLVQSQISEMSVHLYKTTRRHIPRYSKLLTGIPIPDIQSVAHWYGS